MFIYTAKASTAVTDATPPPEWPAAYEYPPTNNGGGSYVDDWEDVDDIVWPPGYPEEQVENLTIDVSLGTVDIDYSTEVYAQLKNSAGGLSFKPGHLMSLTAAFADGTPVEMINHIDDGPSARLVYSLGHDCNQQGLNGHAVTFVLLADDIGKTLTLTAEMLSMSNVAAGSDSATVVSEFPISLSANSVVPNDTAFDLNAWHATHDVDYSELSLSVLNDSLETVALVKADDSPVDITTGWTSSEWSESVKFSEQNEGAVVTITLLRGETVVDSIDVTVFGEQALSEAILERQLAYGITAEWSDANPNDVNKKISLEYPYTLLDYKSYVNKLATGNVFVDPVDNDWANAGNETAAPATLNNATYANAAADEWAVYQLVCAIKREYADNDSIGGVSEYAGGERFEGESDWYEESWLAAKNAADSAWALDGTNAYSYFQSYVVGYYGDYDPDPDKNYVAKYSVVPNLKTSKTYNSEIAHSHTLVGFFESPTYYSWEPTETAFSTHGYFDVAAEDSWSVVAEESSGLTACEFDHLNQPGEDFEPEHLSFRPDDLTQDVKGFVINDFIIITDWEFTHQ